MPGSAPEEIAPLTTTADTKLNMTKTSLYPENDSVSMKRPWIMLLKTHANFRTFVMDMILILIKWSHAQPNKNENGHRNRCGIPDQKPVYKWKNLLHFTVFKICIPLNKLTCFKSKPKTNLKYVGAWRDIVYIPQLYPICDMMFTIKGIDVIIDFQGVED